MTLANILPVMFVLLTTSTIWTLHMLFRLMPLLQLGVTGLPFDQRIFNMGFAEFVVSQCLTAMMLICLFRAIFTHPGSVPNSAAYRFELGEGSASSFEVKHSGERRHCKWCDRYKPDRSHHCRICRTCVLRMDHHCPWISNCVGFRNHKFFFLLIIYALANCILVAATLTHSVLMAVYEETPIMVPLLSDSWNRFLLIYGLTLSCIMGSMLSVFLALHTWLMLKATTTIEYCEKRTHFKEGKTISYDRGALDNIKQVLGENVLLWFLPVSTCFGDGLSFPLSGLGFARTSAEETTPLLGRAARSLLRDDVEHSPQRGGEAGQEKQVQAPPPEVTPERVAAP